MQFPFVGASYPSAILRADAQSTINLYPETDKSGSGKSKVQLVGTPGLQAFVTLPTAPIRGIWIGENRMFVVAGASYYEVLSNATYNTRGTVANDGNPAQMFPNGNQLGIVSGGLFYYDNGAGPVQPGFPSATGTARSSGSGSTQVYWVSGNQFDASMIGQTFTLAGTSYGAVTQVSTDYGWLLTTTGIATVIQGAYTTTSGPVKAYSGTYMDGYAIVSQPQSAQINISGLYDFGSWNVLDYSIKEGYPDHILAVLADQSNLYLMGSNTLEIWRDTGDADFPFQRIPGEVLAMGLVAPWSPDKLPDGVALLGTDFRGGPAVFLLQGYQYSRVSTPPLEKIWQGYSKVSDAVGYAYVDAGHSFYVLSFPTANATWVYDRAEGAWHQRQSAGARTRGYLHGYVWGGHYVGDWQTGQIYKCSLDYYDDAGTAITRQRVASHIANENKRIFYSQFTLDVQTGEVANPTFTLDWSEDGGNTWSNQHTRTPSWAAVGAYATRFNWRRLGHSRMRTFRMTSTTPMRHNWIDGYFDAINSNDGN
jgi:hypothetical protein